MFALLRQACSERCPYRAAKGANRESSARVMLFLLRTPVFPLVLPIRKVYVRTNPSLIPSDPCWYCPFVLHKVDLRLCKLSETLGGVYSWVFALVWDSISCHFWHGCLRACTMECMQAVVRADVGIFALIWTSPMWEQHGRRRFQIRAAFGRAELSVIAKLL